MATVVGKGKPSPKVQELLEALGELDKDELKEFLKLLEERYT